MVYSVLEMTIGLVITQMETHYMSSATVIRMLKRTYAEQMTVQRQEAAAGQATTATPGGWSRSISRQMIACLECGATFKQLSLKHLRKHGLDALTYRVKYGIPPTQSLAVRGTTARRKQIVQ
jgi:predicted transcriptional regulator